MTCTNPKLAVVLDRVLVILLDVVREVVHRDIVVLNILHDLGRICEYYSEIALQNIPTRFLNPRSSLGVTESAFPMTGMTLTRGDRRRINSMSISRRLHIAMSYVQTQKTDENTYA